MTKQVKINKEVHEKLITLKEQSEAKSINDVILALIIIAEEQYLDGKITAANKDILLRYDNGKLIDIKINK